MKRVLIVAVMLLAFTITANADYEKKPITFGLKAGLDMANHHGADKDEFHKFKLGGTFGGFANYWLATAILIQPELLYVMKGYKWDDGSYVEKGKYNYLEMPVLIKYRFSVNGKVVPSLMFGPALAILLSAKQDWEFNGQSGSEDVKDYTKSVDFGIVIGGGVDIETGTRVITFDIRYTLGLTKVPDNPDPNFNYDVKNSVISFLLGFGF